MEKKHREKGHNTGKTQGKHREFDISLNVATLLWTFKLIIKVIFFKLQPILWGTHPPKKMNYFNVSKLATCNILLTAEKHVITLAVNKLACSKPLCAISCNSLHYCPCYCKTRD